MEQGLGDMIQFIRYAAMVKDRAGHVIVECPIILAELFATCPGVDQVVIVDGRDGSALRAAAVGDLPANATRVLLPASVRPGGNS